MAFTRPDAVVCISALQHFNHAPTVIHVKRLDALTRWLQRHPKGLHYPKLLASDKKAAGWTSQIQYHMKVSSGAAFKQEEEKGHSMRGAAFIRALGSDDNASMANAPAHILDYVSRAQRHVTRSTFAAELFSACDACDHGILTSLMLREIVKGVGDRGVARSLREYGWHAIPFCVDH